jgi:hypothetical protein
MKSDLSVQLIMYPPTNDEVYMKMISATWQIFIASVASVLLFATYATGADWDKPVVFQPIDVTGINPAEVAEGDLRPGLTSWYYLEFFERDLQELPKSERSRYPSFAGKPVLQLNHQFDEQNIFDSGTNRGVGIRMKGYIHFQKTGRYEMQALSNDGFILNLSGKRAINDSEQHSDRLSNIAYVTIESLGWYPVVIEYFQRKGTAALKLMWKTPGSSDFVPLPQSAYAHLP